MKKIKKAIIPAAGLGTRFLPATKSIPKEMLPVVDRPILLYVVEEAVRAGIEDIIIIAGRGKTAIEDFFDCSYELEDKLNREGKEELFKQVKEISEMVNIISVRQKKPLGLGHAVLCGKPVVGSEPFAVLLGDEIMISRQDQRTVTQQLGEVYSQKGFSAVAVMAVSPSDVSKYGIVDVVAEGQGLYRVKQVIEKPERKRAPSCLALPGRYVFESQIFDYLETTPPGYGGEIQLTDAMTQLARHQGLYATEFEARRFDAGDKFGYIQANIEMALENLELGGQVKEYLSGLVQRFGD